MGLFRRRGGGPGVPGGRVSRGFAPDDLAHLEQFTLSRRGVEAFVEPATSVTPWTIALVAGDGEWTRRRCTDPQHARALGRLLGIPVYDVHATGYPARMRAWTRAQRDADRS